MSIAATPHVVVIGGGIVGASLAWHLSNSTKVTIVAEDVGGTATPNSFAWLNAASGDQRFYYDFRYRSLQRWREIEVDLPGLPIYWGGSLKWNLSPEELAAFQEKYNDWGYDYILINRSEVSKREPHLSDSALPELGLSSSVEGALEAQLAAQLLVADAQARGSELVKGSATSLVTGNDGTIVGVAVEGIGNITADHIVVAAGLGSVSLLATAGVDLPLTSRAGVLINTKPTEKLINTLMYTQDLHLRQTLDGRIRAGTDGDPSEDPAKDAADVFDVLQQTIDGGEKLEFDYFTVGNRPIPADGLPILGPTGVDGVSVAVMHSGVTNAALVGQLLSKEILTGETDPALADYLLSRFSK